MGERRSGKGAGYIRSRTNGSGTGAFASLTQSLNATPFRGKRLRFSGWVHAEDMTDGVGALWMRVDGASKALGFDNMIDFGRGLSGNRTWQQVAVVLDVPEEAIAISLGALLSGRGVFRVDDLALDTVARSIPVTGNTEPLPYTGDSTVRIANAQRYPRAVANLDFEGLTTLAAPAVSWLEAAAVPFTTDAAGSGLDDLDELGRIVGTARIVGFGEATHGTREFFRMKHRAFEYLVERHGVTWFTIEATMPESRDVDRYITHGEGDPARLLSRLGFWTWNTQEVLDLIQWMRSYNVRAGSPRLRFLGFDMQSADVSVDSVRAITNRLDGPLGERTHRIAGCLDGARDPRTRRITALLYQSVMSAAARGMCHDSLTALQATIQSSRTALLARSDAETVDWLQQYAALLVQWTRMAAATGNNGSYIRDQAMADNLAWAVDRTPGGRFFAWAHNYHVSRRPNTMGNHLDRRFGTNYRVFGFTFGTGQFNAIEQVGTVATNLKALRISSVDTTGIEHLFQQVNRPRLILDARKLLDGGATTAQLLNTTWRMRSIGAVYNAAVPQAFVEDVLLPSDYDGLIWFSTTTASFLLPFL